MDPINWTQIAESCGYAACFLVMAVLATVFVLWAIERISRFDDFLNKPENARHRARFAFVMFSIVTLVLWLGFSAILYLHQYP